MARTDAPDGVDRTFMARALELAGRAAGRTHPNPMVGCVVVRDGMVIGEGWHERAGLPHAEVVALTDAGTAARGATAYVTLEPCAHHGRTPPCTDALIAAGVRRVVYAATDPDPAARGGADVLAAAGLDVEGTVLEDEAVALNPEFHHTYERGRPLTTVKYAQSLDGRVAARDGSSRWISGSEARAASHALRAAHDAVAVGSGTVLVDDPELSVRDAEAPAGQPRPIVFDTRGRIPLTAKVVRPTALVLTTDASAASWRKDLTARGAEVVLCPDSRATSQVEGRGGVNLGAALEALAERGVRSLLVEGGPTLVGALVRESLVDRLVLYIASGFLGADGIPALRMAGPATIDDMARWQLERVRVVGQDVEISMTHGAP